MSKRVRTIVQYSFFFGLGVFLVWWSLKDLTATDKSQIRESLVSAKYWLILPVFFILFSSHLVRALRWRLLIAPLGYNPSKLNTFFAVMIGYLANQAVPRLGEVLKCTALSKYENIPADKLIGTIILERLIDAITLLAIFAITLAIQPELYTQLINTFFHPEQKNAGTGGIPSWITGLIVAGVVAILLLIWMFVRKKKLIDLWAIFRKIARSIIEGISAIRHLKERGLFIFLTVLLWSLYLAGGYIGFMALKETSRYGIEEAFTILSAGSIGMIATPGGIGAYAYLIQKTMQLYGLNEGIALAFGWILWLAQTTVVLLGGLVSFIGLPYFNKPKKN